MFSNNKGFTLLEILVALFVFAIISVIMIRALHTVLSAQTDTAKNSAHFGSLQIALLLIDNDVSQTINRPIKNASNREENAFIGQPQSIYFTHLGWQNPLGQSHHSTLQRTHYYLEKNQLVRETWESLDRAPHTKSNKRYLLNDVIALHFEYLDKQGKFSAKWPPINQLNTNALPCAVRIFITLNSLGKLRQLYLIPGQSLEKPK